MYKSELPFQNEKGIKEWLKVNNTEIYVKTKKEDSKIYRIQFKQYLGKNVY